MGGEISEFFLPKDFGDFCIGCAKCFSISEEECPHYENLLPITKALDASDVIILASPVYVYHATGSMKAFLDHYGYRWMVHRPEAKMFSKQAVCISTAAGAGMKSTNKDMKDSLAFWGVGKIYTCGFAVREISFDRVSDKIKNKIERKTSRISEKIKRKGDRVKPGIKTKVLFYIMRMMQKNGWDDADVKYWKHKGWNGRVRPWKD